MITLNSQMWWDAPNSVRIPTGIAGALILGLRIYSIYRNSKNTKRSPRTRRIENIIAVSLWSFIAIGVTLLILYHRK